MSHWTCVLRLDEKRQAVAGSPEALCDAIRRGADLRIGTAFRHNEHMAPGSEDDQFVREQMDFRVTYLVDDRWAAGVETLRMPIDIPYGFGPRASMSFFLYNQDGSQAVGRPYLDGERDDAADAQPPATDMPKMHVRDSFDTGTNAPSSNFTYDFDSYRFHVRDGWRQVLAHDETGRVEAGSVEALADMAAEGREVKVALHNLCADLTDAGQPCPTHEVFVHLGPCYYYTRDKMMIGGANPLVRVRPGMPMGYVSGGWDFGWLMPRTDGFLARWLCNPYTLRFAKSQTRCRMRWFVSE